MNVARCGLYVGIAAAIVPFAIVVHLVAEAAAVGRDALDLAFVVRHGYFGLLFAAAVLVFGRTAGCGQASSERRRRFALMRADLQGRQAPVVIATLAGANVAFFAVTQAVEGVPVAAGFVGLSLAIALAGSVAAAFLVLFFADAMCAATLDAVIGRTGRQCSPRPTRRVGAVTAPRHATETYSLLRPNRPPPLRSPL